MKQQLMNAAVSAYRSLPLSEPTRRKIKAVALRPFLPRAPFTMNWHGLTIELDPRQSIDMRLHFTRDYEPDTQAVLDRLMPEGGTAIDVGANIGLLSLWLAKKAGPTGKVIAVDPSEWALSRLRRNAELSGISTITPVCAAVADVAGRAAIDVIDGYRVDNVSTHKKRMTDMVTIDSLAEGLDRLDVLKIDTDGYEVQVLQGAAKTLTKLHPAIVFEYGPDALRAAGKSPEELLHLLDAKGYRIYTERLDDVALKDLRIGYDETINLVALPGQMVRYGDGPKLIMVPQPV